MSSQIKGWKVKRLLVIIGLLLTACGTAPQSHGGPVQDQVSLIDALRKSVTVDISGTVAQPFLHPQSGTTVRLAVRPSPPQPTYSSLNTPPPRTPRLMRIRSEPMAAGPQRRLLTGWRRPTSFSRGGCSSSTLGTTRPWSVSYATFWVRSSLGANPGGWPAGGGTGSDNPLSKRAFTATKRLEPDIERAAISGRRTRPSGANTPAAMGNAMPL